MISLSQDKRIAKLQNLTITKRELESLLISLGFILKPGKGSHRKWVKPGCGMIIVATHDKDLKRYQMRQALNILEQESLA